MVLNHSLVDIGIPERIAALMEKQQGILQVKDLLKLTPEQLRATPKLGATYHQVIIDCLMAYGFPIKNQSKVNNFIDRFF